jgi:hypothetical protein
MKFKTLDTANEMEYTTMGDLGRKQTIRPVPKK